MDKTYADWHWFSPGDRLCSGEDYLVCSRLGKDMGDIRIAKYYERGSVVRLELRPDAAPGTQGLSAEEKLIAAILGPSRTWVIPESGFWIMTADYGVDEEEQNGSFRGCLKQPVCVGNLREADDPEATPCWWAEMPEWPDGISEHGETAGETLWDERRERRDQTLRQAMDADPVLKAAVLQGAGEPGSPARRIGVGPCLYLVSPSKFGMRCLAIREFSKKAAGIPREELEAVSEKFFNLEGTAARDFFSSFAEKYGFAGHEKRYLFCCMQEAAYAVPTFFYFRDQILQQGGLRALNTVAVIQEARCRCKLIWQISRLVRLTALKTPDAILQNELRMAAQYETGFEDIWNIDSVNPESFARAYGIWPDGTRYDGHCDMGDLELMYRKDPDEEEDDDGDEYEPKEPRFIWAWAPNFLMREKGGPVFDREKKEYWKKDGKIVMYETEPLEFLAALNS